MQPVPRLTEFSILLLCVWADSHAPPSRLVSQETVARQRWTCNTIVQLERRRGASPSPEKATKLD